ncbi:MAG TPA: hypothetical protein VGC91_06170 [Pyrinomonadaceae bacterium]
MKGNLNEAVEPRKFRHRYFHTSHRSLGLRAADKDVSVNSAGTNGGDARLDIAPVMSADGRFVAFRSRAKNLTAIALQGSNDHNFFRDLYTGVTYLATVNSAGTNGGNGSSLLPRISDNGGVVVFSSFASDLVPNDTNARGDVFAFHTARPGGDFDGDGRNDSAVWNPASGVWSIRSSFDGSSRTQVRGLSSLGDVPVPGEYDGDGKTDLAVFRQGIWYIWQSSNNSLRSHPLGGSGDVAIPSSPF